MTLLYGMDTIATPLKRRQLRRDAVPEEVFVGTPIDEDRFRFLMRPTQQDFLRSSLERGKVPESTDEQKVLVYCSMKREEHALSSDFCKAIDAEISQDSK